jgi:WbqC-like protein family
MFRAREADRVIVSVHQPHFLPWLGYFNKALQSDVFVWLDSVQFRKNYFQNRTRIQDGAGRVMWLTLPVHAHLGMPIAEVRIADPRWKKRVVRTIEQCYRGAPFFGECWPTLERAIDDATDDLSGTNRALFVAILGLLGGGPQVVPVSDLGVSAKDPTERLVEICRIVGADQYVAGRGGKNYVRGEAFEREGIEVLWQEFVAEQAVYRQFRGKFVSGLSVIDCLFNVGSSATREIVSAAWVPGVRSA